MNKGSLKDKSECLSKKLREEGYNTEKMARDNKKYKKILWVMDSEKENQKFKVGNWERVFSLY